MIGQFNWHSIQKRWTNHATNQRSLCNNLQVIASRHAMTMTSRKHFLFVAFDYQLKMEDGVIVSCCTWLYTSDVGMTPGTEIVRCRWVFSVLWPCTIDSAPWLTGFNILMRRPHLSQEFLGGFVGRPKGGQYTKSTHVHTIQLATRRLSQKMEETWRNNRNNGNKKWKHSGFHHIPPYSTLHLRVQVQKADALDLTEVPTMVVIHVIRQGSLQATDHYWILWTLVIIVNSWYQLYSYVVTICLNPRINVIHQFW